MSAAPVFADYVPVHNDTPDENTVMADHWLSFISARQAYYDSQSTVEAPALPKAAGSATFPSVSAPVVPSETRVTILERLRSNVLFGAIQKLF